MLPPIAKECGGRGPWGENVRPLPRASHAVLAPLNLKRKWEMPHPSRSTEPSQKPRHGHVTRPCTRKSAGRRGTHSALSPGPSAQDADSGLQMGQQGREKCQDAHRYPEWPSGERKPWGAHSQLRRWTKESRRTEPHGLAPPREGRALTRPAPSHQTLKWKCHGAEGHLANSHTLK